MYAIVEINGQQFKAEAGQKLFVHHIEGAENGSTVEFEKVLLVDKDGNVTVDGDRSVFCDLFFFSCGKQELCHL